MDLSSELNKVLETYRQMLPAAAVKAVETTPERVTRSPRGGGAPEGTAPKPPKEMGPGTSAFATPAVQRPQPPAKTPVVIPMEEDVPDQPEEREKAPGRTPFGKIKLRFPQPTFGPGFRPPAKAPPAEVEEEEEEHEERTPTPSVEEDRSPTPSEESSSLRTGHSSGETQSRRMD